MDTREDRLLGYHVFEFQWWIFSFAISVKRLRDIHDPKWLGTLFCRLNKHDWWLYENAFKPNPKYKCLKCDAKMEYSK